MQILLYLDNDDFNLDDKKSFKLSKLNQFFHPNEKRGEEERERERE